MICFIPAAGFGSRMKELTSSIPKPLLEVSGRTLLDINISLAYSFGCREFVINTHYLGDQIEEHVKKYKNINIHISKEETEILGTAGGIKTAFNNIVSENDYILVINPDAIFFPSNYFNPLSIKFSGDILLYLKENNTEDGNTKLSYRNNRVYFENGDYYYIGISIIKFGLLKDIPVNTYFDISDLYKKLSSYDLLFGKIYEGDVIDLGDKDKYLQNQNIKLPDYVDCINDL